jgi:transposase
MDLLHPWCAGPDVHQATVVACARWVTGRKVSRETREFGTTTKELRALGDWLRAHEVTHVIMEATGVYWKSVWHVLTGHFELVLANATAVRNVPGRKSDVSDAAWLADLVAHGLVRPSYVPDAATQELRGLTRTRTQLVREHLFASTTTTRRSQLTNGRRSCAPWRLCVDELMRIIDRR